MGNILNDIIDDIDIEIKPNKSKTYIKWTVRISVALIGIAFVLGQINSNFLNKLDSFETKIDRNVTLIETNKKELEAKIDMVYVDYLNDLSEVQKTTKKQLGLIIDYRNSDKQLLKELLDINTPRETSTIRTKIKKDNEGDKN